MDDLNRMKFDPDGESSLSKEDRAALADDVVGSRSTCSICGRIVGGEDDETRYCIVSDCPHKIEDLEGDDE